MTRQAVILDPQDPANYEQRGAVMRALNRKDDAVADYRKALGLKPAAVRRQRIEAALAEMGAAP